MSTSSILPSLTCSSASSPCPSPSSRSLSSSGPWVSPSSARRVICFLVVHYPWHMLMISSSHSFYLCCRGHLPRHVLYLPCLVVTRLAGGLMCKLVAGLQATSIFVSAISITAIALDRYQVIVNPTRQACHPLKTMITLTSIWTLALILASPLFYYRTVESISLKSLSELTGSLFCMPASCPGVSMRWSLDRGIGCALDKRIRKKERSR